MAIDRLPDYLSNPKIVAIIREGFEAHERGEDSSTTPYEPSFDNAWWQQGWEAAAVRAAVRDAAANRDGARADMTQPTGLLYLATPYSKWPSGIHSAREAACALAARMLVAGYKVYSPIAHTHPLAVIGNLDPLDHSIWLPFDEAMMDKADCLIVARLPTWEISKGIEHEIQFFADRHKAIFDLEPETLKMTRRG